MTSDVEVQDSAAPMLDHKETIEELEGQCGHGKKIKGDDHFAMIGEEGEPTFGWIAAAPHASVLCEFGSPNSSRIDSAEEPGVRSR